MPNAFEIETPTDQTHTCLRACLYFDQDRFLTELSAVLGGTVVPLLRSVEGTSSDVWPASGALQEVLPQTSQSSELLTAVGRAGRSHWSTVVECQEDGGILFDFACHVKDEPVWLGSTYELCGVQSNQGESSTDSFEIPGYAARLVCRPCPSTQLDFTPGQVRFSPIGSEPTLPRTDRWKYQFQLVAES